MKNGKTKLLSNKQRKAIALLILKDVNKMNLADIAKDVGISERTLLRWRKREDFSAELIKQAEQMQRAFLADAYVELRKMIASPETKDSNKLKAIELMLRNQGRLVAVKESNVTYQELEDTRTLDDLLFELQNM